MTERDREELLYERDRERQVRSDDLACRPACFNMCIFSLI